MNLDPQVFKRCEQRKADIPELVTLVLPVSLGRARHPFITADYTLPQECVPCHSHILTRLLLVMRWSRKKMRPFFSRVMVINETTLVLADLLLYLGVSGGMNWACWDEHDRDSHGSTFDLLCKLKAQRKQRFAFGCSITSNFLIHLIKYPSRLKEGAAFEKLEFNSAVGHVQVKHSKTVTRSCSRLPPSGHN